MNDNQNRGVIKNYTMHPLTNSNQYRTWNIDEIEFNHKLYWFNRTKPFKYVDIRWVLYPMNKKALYGNFCAFMYLNPKVKFEELKMLMLHANDDFKVGLSIYDVEKMVKSIYNKKESKVLFNNGRERVLIFNPAFSLSTSEKRKIIGKKCGNKAIDFDVINKAIMDLYEESIIITSKKIAEKIDFSKSAVDNHYNLFKDDIECINHSIRLNILKEANHIIIKEGKKVSKRELYKRTKISIPIIERIDKIENILKKGEA